MSKFEVEWTTKKRTDIETSESLTADAYAMQRWGQNSAQEVFELYGVRITQVDEDVKASAVKHGEVTAAQAAFAAKANVVAAAKREAELRALQALG